MATSPVVLSAATYHITAMRTNTSGETGIRIGNQTSCWAATPTEPFEYALASGFDAFEWFPDKKPDCGWDETDLDAARRRGIRETAQTRGLRLSVHARWQANPLKPESLPILLQDLKLAQDLGAVLLNIHLENESGIPAYLEAIVPLIRRTAEAGLLLAVENTPKDAPEQFNELFARLRALDSVPTQHVGMCLDLGHANLCAATRNQYLAFVDRLDPQLPILHLHLHENWGDADAHLPLFTGPAAQNDAGIRGLLDRLRRRNFAGSIILEQWPEPRSLLNQARDRLRALLELDRSARSELPSGGEPDFVARLAASDKGARSWREKLDVVRGLLAGTPGPLTPRQLADVAIYLRFLGTGEVACVEDGRHFRPGHHAEIAQQVQARLAEVATPETAFLIRKIQPWLPSSAQAFRRAEPLTRIRDIAHRNDLPGDLKREIKHTLQNKLHRCAGPEDWVTSQRLLDRITAPGTHYSPAFIEQFRIFHSELKEFFNARSMDERLQALLVSAEPVQAEQIRAFLEQKTRPGMSERLGTLRCLTNLRRSLLEAIEKHPGPQAQELLLADIGLEDFAFVLLSEMLNVFEAAAPGATPWASSLETLALAVSNIGLSNLAPEECRPIAAEASAWQERFDPAQREDLLRLKATAERARRLAEDCSDRILALFPEEAAKLGRALGVAEHANRVFAESEIRGQLIFQLAKLASELLRRIRRALNQPPWDVLVSGQAVGRLMAADTLDQLGRELSEPVVALLRKAEGDEEIPKSIMGLVLAHSLPHLSHLGVRARQAGVVFVAAEDSAAFDHLAALQGRSVTLIAAPDKVDCSPASGSSRHAATEDDVAASRPVRVPEVELRPRQPWLPFEEVRPESGGGKAWGARRLEELARRDGAAFETAPGLVVPFGIMEASLGSRPELKARYQEFLKQINRHSPAEFDAATDSLRDLVRQIPVPPEIREAAAKIFPDEERLIVRSSANCEDLDQLAGAGLYDSIANVAPADITSAVQQVWASLWTRRAALSRKQAGIPHEQAHMAVLIQRLVKPDYSFVLHTVNPVSRNAREVYAELAVGLGETLASAAIRGTPYRLVCDTQSGAVTMLSFASFSQAIEPGLRGSVSRRTVDYSKVAFSCDKSFRNGLAARLARIGRQIEQAFGAPQDIEGAIVGPRIYLLQSRAQQGLGC